MQNYYKLIIRPQNIYLRNILKNIIISIEKLCRNMLDVWKPMNSDWLTTILFGFDTCLLICLWQPRVYFHTQICGFPRHGVHHHLPKDCLIKIQFKLKIVTVNTIN